MRHPSLLLLAGLLAVSPCIAQNEIIVTVAGGGPPDGAPYESALYGASDLAVAPDGRIYFPSSGDHQIFMLDTDGIVHRIAGTGIARHLGDGGPADEASFVLPSNLVLTPEGDLIVRGSLRFSSFYDMPPPPVELKDLSLRRIDAGTGIVSTIADGRWGLTVGPLPAENAPLTASGDLLLAPSGDLFLSGSYTIDALFEERAAIHRIDHDSWMIQIVAGGGGSNANGISALQALFNYGPNLAMGPSGILLASDGWTDRVRSVDLTSGVIDTVAGNGTQGNSGDGGPAVAAEITALGVIVNSEDDLFIASSDRVRVVDAETGLIETVAGNGIYDSTGDGGPATAASVKASVLGFDADENLYIFGAGDIRKVDAATGIISSIARAPGLDPLGDGGPAEEARLYRTVDVGVAPNGDLYIANATGRIRKVDASSGTIATIRQATTVPASLGGIAVHPDGIPYYSTYHTIGGIAGINNWSGIWRIGPGGTTRIAGAVPLGYSGDGGPAVDATLKGPLDLAFDMSGNLFIADTGNRVIRRIDAATGIIDTVAGGGTPGVLGDGGPALGASFDAPVALAVDSLGNLFVGDSVQRRVRRVDAASGFIETVAGNGEPGSTGDGGPAIDAGLTISRIAIDPDGNLYISGDERVRKVDAATGTIDTIAGTGILDYSGDGGPAIEAALGGPRGMAIDQNGELLIACFESRRVRQVGKPLRVTATPSVLPRSHELIDIELTVEGTRLFEPVEILLDSVVSNEPDDVPGGSDGNTIGDIQDAGIGTADFAIRLRGERDARGEGRVYTIRYVGIDADGVQATGETSVVVPRTGPPPK